MTQITPTQISPNPNPNKSEINLSDSSLLQQWVNDVSFVNEGAVIIQSGGYFTNNSEFDSGFKSSDALFEIQDSGEFRNLGNLFAYSELVNQEGGILVNTSNMNLIGGKSQPTSQFLNSGKFNNFFDLDLTSSEIKNNASGVVNNGVSPDATKGVPTKALITLKDSTFTNLGDVENYGSVTGTNSFINIDDKDNATWTNYAGSQIGGNLTINGTMRGATNYAPGLSAGGIKVNGSLVLTEDSSKTIELGGDFDGGRDPSNTEHDFIDVAGDLILDGGTLDVKLIDGFELGLNQEFIIAKVDGELTGTYDGLEQGAIVGSFDSIFGEMDLNLFIDYTAGDGNDIALSTSQIF